MTNFESKTDIQQILTNIHQYHYTTNPHERSASNGRALVGISGVDMERFQNMNDLLTQESVIC